MIVNESMVKGVLPILGFSTLEEVTEESVKAAYKDAAKRTHPDMTGGDGAAFALVDRAKCIMEAWLKRTPTVQPTFKKEDCGTCGGTGRRRINRGFSSMSMMCGTCHGTGDAAYEPDRSDN